MTETPGQDPYGPLPPSGRQRRGSRRERPALRIRTGVKAMVLADGRALLVREQRADGSSFWTLPGGGVEPGESLPGGLRREVAEELQCPCVVGPPVGTCRYRHATDPGLETLYVVLSCSLQGTPLPAANEGIIDARWASSAAPPAGTLRPVRQFLLDVDTGGNGPSE